MSGNYTLGRGEHNTLAHGLGLYIALLRRKKKIGRHKTSQEHNETILVVPNYVRST